MLSYHGTVHIVHTPNTHAWTQMYPITHALMDIQLSGCDVIVITNPWWQA